jgi:predicted ATPase
MEAASSLLREAFETVAESGERMFERELHRLHGELLLRTRRYSEAETEFARALEVARELRSGRPIDTLEPARPASGFGIKSNWPVLALIALGFALLLAAAVIRI